MSVLLVPIAPLSRAKTRLRECFSKEQLKNLTIAMFKDLARILLDVKCYEQKIIYCNSSEILELADDNGLIGIKEEISQTRNSFDDVINHLNNLALKQFNAKETVLVFSDLVLITAKNFRDIASLMKKSQVVVCPAIYSGGISILGRKPPKIVPACFSDPNNLSFIALHDSVMQKGLSMSIYDSFRAGFDVDLKQDLILAREYLKIFNLTHTHTYKFLKNNFNFSLQKSDASNNRKFLVIKNDEKF